MKASPIDTHRRFDGETRDRAKGVTLALGTAVISGVAVFMNSYGVKRFASPSVYTTAKNLIAGVVLVALAAALMFLRSGERPVLANMVEGALEGAKIDIAVEPRTVEGSAAKALIDASAEADPLVVGARGRGGLERLVVGSVSQQCAHHAHCPVLIMRPPRTGRV